MGNRRKRAVNNQETMENVESLMVDRKESHEYLRKNGILKDASATKHPCNLKHCDERMYCIVKEIQNCICH